MDNIILSVVVPVYNVSEYIEKCVKSIIEQSYDNNIEIILIDDGSTDGSGLKCDYYKEHYKNVIVLHKENEGVSIARNCGVAMARGKYISFVDGDDYIDSNTYAIVMKIIIEEDLDIVAYGFYGNDIGDDEYSDKCEYIKQKEAIKMCITDDTNNMMCASVCNKVFNLERLKKKLRFNCELMVAEDMCVTIDCIMATERLGQIRKKMYHYRKRESSVSHTYKIGKASSVDAHNKMIEMICEKYPEYEKIIRKRSAWQSYQLLKQAIRTNGTDKDIKILLSDIYKNKKLLEISIMEKIVIDFIRIPLCRPVIRCALNKREVRRNEKLYKKMHK